MMYITALLVGVLIGVVGRDYYARLLDELDAYMTDPGDLP